MLSPENKVTHSILIKNKYTKIKTKTNKKNYKRKNKIQESVENLYLML